MGYAKSIDQELSSAIFRLTGRVTGVAEVPAEAIKPFYLVYPMPSGSPDPIFADVGSIANLMYQVDVVGSSAVQVEEAEYRVSAALTSSWRDISTRLMGPPEIRRNAIVREDERTFKSTIIITVKVGG